MLPAVLLGLMTRINTFQRGIGKEACRLSLPLLLTRHGLEAKAGGAKAVLTNGGIDHINPALPDVRMRNWILMFRSTMA